ncbi:MAG: xanthine dehydrogenase family protein molybdopterin-binding subunit [Acidobacteriaceae bacterium]|nr:xanthine dehydrogenase family protein molybdopterin-binding subunit [Acidobacteriaceae bacterium]
MSVTGTLSRRTLIKTGLQGSAVAGAALVIGFDVAARAQEPEKKVAINPLKAWLRVDQNGKITLIYSKSEMGQGVSTSLPMILADALGVDWKDIRVEHGELDPALGDQGTGGSGSVADMWLPLRQAGAAAREMLIGAAAQRWNVSPETCTAKGGAVWHGDEKLSYAELVPAAAQLPVPAFDKVRLKSPDEFEYIGKSLPRTDIPSKVDGSAVFGLDVRVPGMVYAVVARCPVFGGKVKKLDASEAKALKGVIDVFEIPAVAEGVHSAGGVVVVAETTYIAMEGRKLLAIEWDNGPGAAESSETLRRQFRKLVDSSMKVVLNQGNTEQAISNAPPEKKIEVDYELPFQAHAAMEPLNCTMHIQSDRAEAWAASQSPNLVQGVIQTLTGLPPEKIQVHTTFMGGAFGRRYQWDFPTEAAQIAKRVNKPVQLVWSREDDMMHDFYRPASYHRMSGALDADGNITGWRHKYTSTSIAEMFDPKASPESSEVGLTTQIPYLTKSYRLEYLPAKSVVPRAWWRSVEASVIGFVMESFIDELARAGKVDPYEFRLRLIGGPREVNDALNPKERPLETARLKGVLQLAADKGDWGKTLPAGQGRGIACHYSFHTYVANLVEVAVNKGAVKVNRVVSAVDLGTAVNPNGIHAQIESAIIYGLTAALKSQITIQGGRVEQSNFNKFTTLSMKETPKIEVYIVPSTAAPTGIGEPALPPTAPALTNAIFAATGKRIRRLPIQPGDLA